MENRNPYIILGIPFGASREVANRAYARKAKGLRGRGAEGRDQLTDLTWALNQVDEATRHPATQMGFYRIPADPAVLAVTGTGVFKPPPETLPSGGDAHEALEALYRAAAHEHLRQMVSLQGRELRLPPP